MKKKIKELKELITLIIIALTIKTCLIEVYVVPTGSMEKTILIGDMLIGNKFIYGMRTPNWIGIPYTRIGFLYLILDYQNSKKLIIMMLLYLNFPETLGKNMLKDALAFQVIKLTLKKGIYILMEN